MAGRGLAPAELLPQEHPVSAPPSADFLYLYGRERQPAKDDPYRFTYPEANVTPANKYDIALPITSFECNCGSCIGYTRHHLHSTDPLFRAAGGISTEFRALSSLTVWIARCRHKEQHNTYSVNTFLPDIEIMEQCIYEEKILRGITVNTSALMGLSRRISRPDTHPREAAGLRQWRERLLAERPALLAQFQDIFVTPEELVTGALLYASPNHGRGRLMEGSGYVLTGTIPKDQAAATNNFAQSVLREMSTLQTGVDEVELAA